MNPSGDKSNRVGARRQRVSLLLLMIGLGTLLIGVGIYIRRDGSRPEQTATPAQTDPSSTSGNSLASKAFQTWLIYSTVILIAFVAASYAIVRNGRRYRIQLVRKSPDVTPTPDIWRMHRPPEDAGLSGSDPESGAGPP